MKEISNKQKLDELLSRGVGEFIDPDGAFRKKLETAPEKIVIKFGIDPTRPDIHIGHAVVLRKLRQFQDLGCKVIFLVGDFTALIGDPTGKSKVRPEIEQKEISLIMETFVRQIPKILKIEPVSEEDKKRAEIGGLTRDSNNFIVESPWFSWMRNSDWFFNVTDIDPTGASQQSLVVNDENGKVLNIKIPKNSFFEKAVVFENTRMQKLLKRKEIKTVSFVNFLAYLRLLSHSQLIERDMFQQRINKGEPLFMHEMMYPVAQGIDSNIISDIYGSCDLEVGGTDQTFNMLMGRTLMKFSKKEPQAILAFEILEGLDGKEKMSKSLDNYIGINEDPNEMFGKIMSIPDNLITKYFLLCTDTSKDIIDGYARDMDTGKVNPRDLKMLLGKELVTMYHSKEEAEKAEENFIATFQKKEIPKDITEIKADKNDLLVDIFLKNNIVSSKTEFRRLIDENAITYLDTNEKITEHTVKVSQGVYRIGKKRFCKISLK
ncbi:MAG: tyrosine--tRNA ligase [Patescibacteria group bacterium]|nr:tyrosine--tRNA ligase [Patescibacteria group bacterium]